MQHNEEIIKKLKFFIKQSIDDVCYLDDRQKNEFGFYSNKIS